MDRQAKHALVVGAGFIGVEITENCAAAASRPRSSIWPIT